jgi:hypothetical protein
VLLRHRSRGPTRRNQVRLLPATHSHQTPIVMPVYHISALATKACLVIDQRTLRLLRSHIPAQSQAHIFILIKYQYLNTQVSRSYYSGRGTHTAATFLVFSKYNCAHGVRLTTKFTSSVALKTDLCTAPTAAMQVYAHARTGISVLSQPPPGSSGRTNRGRVLARSAVRGTNAQIRPHSQVASHVSTARREGTSYHALC